MLKTPRRKLATLLCAACLVAPQLAAEPVQLPDIGAAAGSVLSPQKERELGEAFLRSLRQQAEIIEDSELQDYLQSLGQRLAAGADHQPFGFQFFLVKDDAINAFAAPGGFIGVHSGLVKAARTESELAGVLAHEIAHVTQRHMARSYEAASRLSLPTAAALLGAILLGTQNSEAGQAAIMAVQAGSAQYQINFTRANEREADRIGIQILADAGLDTMGMPDFFRRLLQQTRYVGNRPPEFLSTHPVTTDRIAEAEERASHYPDRGIRDRTTFQLAKARLRVLTTDNKRELIKEFAAESDQEAVSRYGLALALQATGANQRARNLLQDLARHDPDRIAYQAALGQLELSDGNVALALKLFSNALKSYPGNKTLAMNYGRALLQAGRAQEAVTVLEQLLRDQSAPDPAVYALLARADDKAGKPAQSYRAMAEHYYLFGNTRAAIEQLTIALRVKDLSFYETTRLEARLQELKQQLQQGPKQEQHR